MSNNEADFSERSLKDIPLDQDCQPPRWLEWAREIQALAQTGYHYSTDNYNRERYVRLAEIAAEIISSYSQLAFQPLVEVFQAQVGYATPRVDVRGAVFQDGKLLMVRERADGGWTLPGGWADVGDVPSRAAEREVLEEAGLEVKACKVVGLYDANRVGPLEVFHAFKIVFLCELLNGEPRSSEETSDAAYFSQAEIPSPLSGERTRPRHIQDAFAAYHDPGLPAVFD
jgi:ADP-ribose pyrophosphatase YjhB (NUDIX family)